MQLPRTFGLFTRWFILCAVTAAASIFAAQQGFFTLVLQTDRSYLSAAMAVLFVGTSLYAGRIAYDCDVGRLPAPRSLKILHFIGDQFTTLGLLGTAIGFCLLMHGTLDATIDVATIIAQLKVGTSTALYTTLVGIICSILVGLQTFMIENRP